MSAVATESVDIPFSIAGREFRSRLMVGTGKYASNQQMVDAINASGAEVVTVAVRRVDLSRRDDANILTHLDPDRFFLLANTAGCYTTDDAIRYARLARAAGFNEWVKLEVIGDQATLLPDTASLIEATRVLTAEGFKVLAYTNDDLITALMLEQAGAAAVMPLASPIGDYSRRMAIIAYGTPFRRVYRSEKGSFFCSLPLMSPLSLGRIARR